MRRAFRRRVWGASLAAALLLGAISLVAVLTHRLVSLSETLAEINQGTLAKIPCHEPDAKMAGELPTTGGKICDIAGIENDPSSDPSDYVLSRRTRYFLYMNDPHPRGFWLNFSDVEFSRRFREPTLQRVETGEIWKLYSESAEVDGKGVEVMVAHLEYTPSRLVQCPGGPDIDEQLRKEAQKIVQQIQRGKENVNSRADGWQVVDGETGRVRQWNANVPAIFPKEGRVPWIPFHLEGSEVWLARTARSDDLEVVSVGPIGDLYSFGLLGLGVFSLGLLVTYPIAKRYGRTGMRHPMPLEEALKTGESEYVEFKQEVKERQQLLKEVTAFANTHGGTVFIGILDNTREVVGIGITPEQKDSFELGLRDSIRQSIHPSPNVDVDFLEKDGRLVARVFVRASPKRHSFEGRYYVREGSQSRFLIDDQINDL